MESKFLIAVAIGFFAFLSYLGYVVGMRLRREQRFFNELREKFGDQGLFRTAPLTCSTEGCDNCIGQAAQNAEPGGFVEVIMQNGVPLMIGREGEWYPVTEDARDEVIDMINKGGAYSVLPPSEDSDE